MHGVIGFVNGGDFPMASKFRSLGFVTPTEERVAKPRQFSVLESSRGMLLCRLHNSFVAIVKQENERVGNSMWLQFDQKE